MQILLEADTITGVLSVRMHVFTQHDDVYFPRSFATLVRTSHPLFVKSWTKPHKIHHNLTLNCYVITTTIPQCSFLITAINKRYHDALENQLKLLENKHDALSEMCSCCMWSNLRQWACFILFPVVLLCS